MFKKILVAYDDTPEAGRALQTAIQLARTVGADVGVVTVLQPLPSYYSFAVSVAPILNWRENTHARCVRLQAQARRRAAAAGLYLDTDVISGDRIGAVLEGAQRFHADLLVMGVRRRTWLIDGAARGLADCAPCALLRVR